MCLFIEQVSAQADILPWITLWRVKCCFYCVMKLSSVSYGALHFLYSLLSISPCHLCHFYATSHTAVISLGALKSLVACSRQGKLFTWYVGNLVFKKKKKMLSHPV